MIGLAHHWLVGMRGGEKVLEQFQHIFPNAPIYTLVANPERLSSQLKNAQIVPSLLQKIPAASTRHQKFLPLYPLALKNLSPLPETTFILSSDASVIKGMHIPEYIPHVCYCHSPPRYLWDLTETYASKDKNLGFLGRTLFRTTVPFVRKFDYAASQQVSQFIANSRFVQDRIWNFYQRESTVIHPPVDTEQFSPETPSEDFYLIVSEITPYKRIDLAVEAFKKINRRLVIVGDGPLRRHLENHAPSNIEFKGRVPDSEVKMYFEKCRAFIFPQIEDFGITAVEAQAAGKPVIAYKAGGALDSVIEGQTGLFFNEQTPSSLADSIIQFEKISHDQWKTPCRNNALQYGNEKFRSKIIHFLKTHYPDKMSSL